MSISVNFCHHEVHQKLKFCDAPGWQDAPEEGGKERQREICQKLVGSSGSYISSRAELSQAKLRWGENNLHLLQDQLIQVLMVSAPIPTAHKTQILAG